jgi:CDP-diacylglycerol---glycerol-3-phosphate 3-phosphatidyltransferase
MFSDGLKKTVRSKFRPIVLACDRMGMTPDSISVIGLLISFVAAIIAARGNLFVGAIVLWVGSALDMVDGDLARLQGTSSKRGAFIDSNFDRLAEAGLFAGLAWYYMTALDSVNARAVLLIILTLSGSLTTSYARARAEGLGVECFGGWLQRPERIIMLILGMLFGRFILEMVLAVLAVATIATTVQRIYSTAKKLGDEKLEAPESE